jgi:ubiquinone/menaquinone biosynthesis C-methylase UbiE
MLPFLRKGDAHALSVAMAAAKMGDQILQVACADGGRLGAIAVKVGLSGRASAVVPDEESAERARKGAARAGALVDVIVAPPTHLPMEDAAFTLVVVDDTGGLLPAMAEVDRTTTAREILRVLKAGGRAIVIGAVPATGWRAAFSRTAGGPTFDPQPMLQAGGFRLVRHLAEREGLQFVEGVKGR